MLHPPPLDWSRPTPSSALCCPGPASCTWTPTCDASRATIVSLALTAQFLFTVVMTFCLCCACSAWWLMQFVLASDHSSPWLVASVSPYRIFRSCCRLPARCRSWGPSSDCLPEALPCRPCLPLAPSASPSASLAPVAAAGSDDALESLSSESSDSSAEEATAPDEPALFPTPKAVSPPPSASVSAFGHLWNARSNVVHVAMRTEPSAPRSKSFLVSGSAHSAVRARTNWTRTAFVFKPRKMPSTALALAAFLAGQPSA